MTVVALRVERVVAPEDGIRWEVIQVLDRLFVIENGGVPREITRNDDVRKYSKFLIIGLAHFDVG